MRMPFGKHRGEELSQIPADYLEWLLSLSDLRNSLRQAVAHELGQRQTEEAEHIRVDTCPDVQAAEAVIKAGVKTLSLRHHPDRGGNHEDMVSINLAAEWLRRRLRVLAS